MRHALKPIWQDEAEPALGESFAENVLRFEAASLRRAAEPEHRSEVADVLDALQRASDHIRHADVRAAQAEDLARELEARALASEERAGAADEQAALLEQRLRVADESARNAERKFIQISDWHSEKVGEAQAALDEALAVTRSDQDRIAELERSLAEQSSAVQSIIQDAGQRIFAAESRAIEATRDFEALRDYIRNNLSV